MSDTASLSKDLVQQKLKLILADIGRIDAMLNKHSYEEIVTSEPLSSLAERRVERVINRAIDINLHVLRSVGVPPPNDYTHSFLDLADAKVVSPEFAQSVAPCVGVRNILVHEYDDLDAMQFYSSLKDAVRLFPEYAKAMNHFVGKGIEV